MTFAERLGNASFVSHGGVVVGAAAMSLAAGDSWEKRIDRALEKLGNGPSADNLPERLKGRSV